MTNGFAFARNYIDSLDLDCIGSFITLICSEYNGGFQDEVCY